MEFDFSPSEEQFRAELRQLLAQHLPSDWSNRSLAQAPDAEERRALAQTISKQLADRKWLAMAWPKEHGGLDSRTSSS